MMSERRYGYSETIESIIDMKDSTDGSGIELTTSDVVSRLNQLEAENEALREYIIAVRKEVDPIVALHQVRNFDNQVQFPRCNEAWKNIPEDVRALLTVEDE